MRLLLLLLLFSVRGQAQISIGGNVYGGGNEGETGGSTTVTVRRGTIKNVYGGARMANVGGRAFVNIDGENSEEGRILIGSVYGGNDIAGTVGTRVDHTDTGLDAVPAELTEVLREGETAEAYPEKNAIDNSWDAFIRSSKKESASYDNSILIGTVYGGGNGDYTYDTTPATDGAYAGKYTVKDASGTVLGTSDTPFTKPVLQKTYLEINGGCLAHVYGGGNMVTVTANTVISMNNTSQGLQELVPEKGATETDAEYQARLMAEVAYFSDFTGISTFQSDLSSINYTSTRVFGGNNKAEMTIQPHWNLRNGKIRDLYSGGNQGDMTYMYGLLLEIPETSNIDVINVFGGCRRADVRPMDGGVDMHPDLVQLQDPAYKFPAGLSARVIVRGGNITNVYGGNDVSGEVYGGTAVGIYHSIRGDVYGGGNGSYTYTDNADLADDVDYGDYFYDVNAILGKAEGYKFTSLESAEALFKHRPHAERVSLRLWGTETNNTIVGGSVYVGGNSATLMNNRTRTATTGELKIGSYVLANNVFLGNNGESMVDSDILSRYAGSATVDGTDHDFSAMDLLDAATFARYMEGCASFIKPDIVFDKKNADGSGDPDTYQEYTTQFGSVFCGGNVGSMMWEGTAELDLNHEVVIFDKLVGGCNDAVVPASAYNAYYQGGVLGSAAEQASGAMDGKNALVLNLSGLKIEPKRWKYQWESDGKTRTTDASGNYIYVTDANGNRELEWDVFDASTGEPVEPPTPGTLTGYVSTTDDLNRRLHEGNIYGGCYKSGIVNGNIVINVNNTIMDREKLFDVVAEDALGEAIFYGTSLDDIVSKERNNYHILERRTGVIIGSQGMDVLGNALNIFGGGYGKDTEVWGSTTINLNAGYVFQIFGGSEEGVIGKPGDAEEGATDFVTFNGKDYYRNSKYSCTVNVCGTKAGVSKQDDASEEMAEAEFIYGGGYLGPICGNTAIRLGNGRVFNTFGGSCMADILGHTETYMGLQSNRTKSATDGYISFTETLTEGFPYVRDYIYCGNDLGGKIYGSKDFSGSGYIRPEAAAVLANVEKHGSSVTTASAYAEYRQGRASGIFGGCFGTYDYSDPYYGEFFYSVGAADLGSNAVGSAREGYTKPRLGNAFVNFRPTDTDALQISSNKYNFVGRVYGAGQGYPADADRDIMQKSSYVLIDIPQRMLNYQNMETFGCGAWSGVGMYTYIRSKSEAMMEALSSDERAAFQNSLDHVSATIDLVRGQIGAAYGGSYAEGVTRRTLVNVPSGSTIRLGSIFGGAYGTDTYMPCDVYESNVEYHSADATLIYNPTVNPLQKGSIYGGNNNERRTLYAKVDIDTPVRLEHYQNRTDRGYVYGAGYGANTWAEYTEVELRNGAEVFEVYGGGQAGKVLNAESVQQFIVADKPDTWKEGTYKAGEQFTDADWDNAWRIGGDYDSNYDFETNTGEPYWENSDANLANPLVRLAEADDRDWTDLKAEHAPMIVNKYNTNVIIGEGATVGGYAYGGGLGSDATVDGHTYIALLGGTVTKDIYAGGTSGAVEDSYGAGLYHSTNDAGFTATTTAYIKGGTVRNVYGGGWKGDVGHHEGAISEATTNDILGETHVIIGDTYGTSITDGIPAITRSVYGAGEGGSVFGTAYVKIYNGYIGYRYDGTRSDDATTADFDERYVEELDDVAPGDNLLEKGGNVFGGGYVANSYTDFTDVKMYGGNVRGCMFGGGEIGPVGRGTVNGMAQGQSAIYKGGRTDVRLYSGHVMRDVFGGGRGYDSWNGDGTKAYSAEEVAALDLSSKGYIFGNTQVYIRGGEIGTNEGTAKGFGNVFGGGDRGFVYSAEGKKSGVRYNVGLNPGDPGYGDEGYYYEWDKANGTFVDYSGEKKLTEDCKVLVGPQCKAKEPITIANVFYPKGAPIPPQDLLYMRRYDNANPGATLYSGKYDEYGNVTADDGITIASRTYDTGEYVTTYALNSLKDKTNDPEWAKVEETGVEIHNAIFAGGNVYSGDDQVYANAPTVFGNASASIHDVYNHDLVTVGTGHTGGLYGDGNLTFVDGFRSLNITNYGTDYYNLVKDIDFGTYSNLTEREKAYYELMYECTAPCTDKDGTSYSVGAKLSLADLQTLFVFDDTDTSYTNIYNANGSISDAYWEQKGVCSLYAGRIMNTVQRADFCGVFGSRMVLQGAPDRVPETVDYTNYTINRVREVSLNKKVSVAGDTGDKAVHGNYFGIYSIVNFLGHLTSDVNMTDVRRTENTSYPSDSEGQTYYDYKANHYTERNCNRAASHNKLALASGVYLELTTEKGTGTGVNEKDWGYITGVVELDLINVQKGVGGGYVYAKNVHGTRAVTGYKHTTLSALNMGAVTRRDYTYSDDGELYKTATDLLPFETSGNFVHDTQIIIDDCYDVGARYQGDGRSPAHYWYIKGEVYVYDQYISAYTGSPAAYKETVSIPLTVTAQSHGKMKLLNVQPNLYAYYKSSGNRLGSGETMTINNVSYSLNQPIDYWTWSLLPAHERALFVEETYTTIDNCYIGTTLYPKGYTMLQSEYDALKNKTVQTYDSKTESWTVNAEKPFTYMVRKTNNISHDTGYILTYTTSNPMQWDNWYTPQTGSAADKKNTTDYSHLSDAVQNTYNIGPTYSIKSAAHAGIYGQHEYSVSDIIDAEVYNTYQSLVSGGYTLPSGQASFAEAYIVTADELETKDASGTSQKLSKGSALARENYKDEQWDAISGSVTPALVVTNTIQVSNSEYLYTGELVTAARKEELIAAAHSAGNTELENQIANSIVGAYYCTSGGLYGGNYYSAGKNYRGLEAWSSMSKEDRAHFTFNYDALDLLIDPTYGGTVGQKYQYDDKSATLTAAEANAAQYSLQRSVDYTATYDGSKAVTLATAVTVKHSNGTTESTTSIVNGDELDRETFESLPNEQYHYTPIEVTTAGSTVYVVTEAFMEGDSPYTVGQTLSLSEYNSIVNGRGKIASFTFDNAGTYYYCRDSYTIDTGTYGQAVTNVYGTSASYSPGSTVPVGVIISDTNYDELVNTQLGFSIHGVAPLETSTLYVARHSDIYDLSQDKIITVIYQYDYEDSDDSGKHISAVSERHIVNIHLQFKSGIPFVEEIKAPDLVLPGTSVVIRTPNVTPGAYEVLGGGWEIYRNSTDADNHSNGTDYSPSRNPLYWYQDGYYVAYYAKTYLGKTYSNAVQLSVANYHDLKKVWDDNEHHYYIDHSDAKRDPKIYINDYSSTSENGLTMLKNLFDLSLLGESDVHLDPDGLIDSGTLQGHALLNSNVGDLANLEFFLRTDLSADGSWTPIGEDNAGKCFEGILHGDGHTVSGLDNSLFAHLCGEVYNLGVTGSFTSAGLADEGTGFVENCWVKSTATAAAGVKAVFNDPTDTSTRTNHVVNCYYPSTGGFTGQTGTTEKSEKAFYDGEVTYDLNEFYLFKRYCDNTSSITGDDYAFLKDVDGTLTKQTSRYATVEGPYLVNDATGNYVGSYVESRFADGDFIYAGGYIPGSPDQRLYTDAVTGVSSYLAIWPDDYFFFGQTLTYGHDDTRAHQELPSVIIRNADRLPTASTAVKGNRVYRTPAYYRSSAMDVAYFNHDVILAQTKKGDASMPVHRYMTALDFTGYNDISLAYEKGLSATRELASTSEKMFYPPLLDDDGISSMQNIDLTRNLLVYTGTTGGTGSGQTPTASQQTANVVSAYLLDQAYAETNDDYRTVDVWDSNSDNVKGHWVQAGSTGYTAQRDHLLVDRQDFNAPIGYTFAPTKRMWHQRTPNLFVDRKKGWEAISLPFGAEIVTTQRKGELTHFYQTTNTVDGVNTGATGHEYWLRHFTRGGKVSATDANIYEANFTYPAAGSNTKDYTNTFLWDYYYQYNSSDRQDKNTDVYQQDYYASPHTFSDYPYSEAGTPYIVGFPGTTYYEFDLSGSWQPANTLQTVARLARQTVTFASPVGTSIAVSDTELADAAASADGYLFKPNYLGVSVDAGAYVLNADGSSFKKTAAATTAVPFRPYFTLYTEPSRRAETRAGAAAETIVFANTAGIVSEPTPFMADDPYGGLNIYAKKGKVVVESQRSTEGIVRILTPAGLTVTTFAIQPGEVIETPVHATGVYIVNNKKLRVESRK